MVKNQPLFLWDMAKVRWQEENAPVDNQPVEKN